MDINLLVLNVGNTRIAAGRFVAGQLDGVVRIAHGDRAALEAGVAALWEDIKDLESPAIAAASVNPQAAEPLESAIERLCGQKVHWVGSDIDLPIKVLTDAPGETGADRVLNIAAAYEQMHKACVVVDAGTAITVDLCNDAGDFLGGAIAPGLRLMAGALSAKTARLPEVAFDRPAGPYGRTTTEAIRQGLFHGVRGMVKELVENYATELGNWPDVIATGGDAAALFEGWELIHAISPNLSLYGIALAYAEHHIRNAS